MFNLFGASQAINIFNSFFFGGGVGGGGGFLSKW